MSKIESELKEQAPVEDLSVANETGEVEFIMGWYGRPIAKMKYSGVSFGFDYESGWLLPLESYEHRKPGKEPMFLRSLLPAWVGENNGDKVSGGTMAAYFKGQELFLSNIAIVESVERLKVLGYDHLHARLKDYTSEDGVFIGEQKDIEVMTREMITNMKHLAKERRLTQISGAQTKIPMFLSPEGNLLWQLGLPSTHIIKYAGFGGDSDHVRGAAEWTGMTLARAGGMICAEFALIEMPSEKGLSLNYLTERFDIPSNKEDQRMIFCEEVGASMGYHPGASDMLILNDVIEGIFKHSTNKRGDMIDLFKQVAVNCILENADFHARNMSLLKVASPTLDHFRSVRLSPAYDVMRTRDFAKTPVAPNTRERMRLSYQDDEGDGESIQFDKPTIAQFCIVGKAMGLSEEKSEEILRDVSLGMMNKAIELREKQPLVFDRHEYARIHVIETCDAVIRNVLELFQGFEFKNELEKISPPVPRNARARP